MSARPDDFPPTTLGELPAPFSPLLDMSRHYSDVPVPMPPRRKPHGTVPPRPMPAPAPISFPDPQEVNRLRIERQRKERAAEAAAIAAEMEQAQEVGSAYARGRQHGSKAGFVSGMNRGLALGSIAGLMCGAALVVGFIQLGRWAV